MHKQFIFNFTLIAITACLLIACEKNNVSNHNSSDTTIEAKIRTILKSDIPQYEDISCAVQDIFGNCHFIGVSKNGKYGFIDNTGKEITPIHYDNAAQINPDDYFVDNELLAVQKNNKWGFIDKTGKEIIPLQYDKVSDFYDNLAKVKKNNQWGFIDKTGKEIIKPHYDNVEDFHEGFAVITSGKFQSLINKNGDEILPFFYNKVSSVDNGIALLEFLDGTHQFLNTDDGRVFGFEFNDNRIQIEDILRLGNNFFIQININYKKYVWLLANKDDIGDGDIKYDEIKPVNPIKNIFAVKKDNKYGLIDNTGNEIVPLQYDHFHYANNELVAVQKGNKWGLIDNAGKEIVPLQYDNFHYANNELVAVKKGNKWGLIDNAGKEIVPLQYDHIGDGNNGLLAVEKGNKWGVVDNAGQEIVPLQYDFAESIGDLSIARKGNISYLFDKTGKLIFQFIQKYKQDYTAECEHVVKGSEYLKDGFIFKIYDFEKTGEFSDETGMVSVKEMKSGIVAPTPCWEIPK